VIEFDNNKMQPVMISQPAQIKSKIHVPPPPEDTRVSLNMTDLTLMLTLGNNDYFDEKVTNLRIVAEPAPFPTLTSPSFPSMSN
jgi:hypothetical protein